MKHLLLLLLLIIGCDPPQYARAAEEVPSIAPSTEPLFERSDSRPIAVKYWKSVDEAAEDRRKRSEELPPPIEPIAAVPDALLRFGAPEGSIIKDAGWCFAYDGRTRCPRWTLEYLTPDTLKGNAVRKDNFFSDPRIPSEFRSARSDYDKSGFDKGHFANAGNYGDSCSMDSTFSMANMSPQDPSLNRGVWAQLESEVRDLAQPGCQVWVITAPMFLKWRGQVTYRVIGQHDVAVPTHYLKSALWIDAKNDIRMRTWTCANKPPGFGVTTDQWRIDTDSGEKLSGLDLWAGLPDELENKLEAVK